MKNIPIKLLVAAVLLGQAALTFASDKSATVFPAEGNKQCSDYSSNAAILQMGTSSPTSAGLLSGAENPQDADTIGESAIYTIANSNTAGFNSTTPIDYAILKSSREISVIIYPSGGVKSDANMQLLVASQPLTITAISLCYGLGNTPPPPPPPPAKTTIPSCSALNATGGIDGVTIQCPSDTTKTSVIYNFEVGQNFFNAQGSPLACVCNSDPLTECDPSKKAGETGACISETGSKTGAEIPLTVEINNDPYTCYVSGGTKKCYCLVDADPSVAGCQ